MPTWKKGIVCRKWDYLSFGTKLVTKRKEAISLKKAIMSVQSDFKDKMISVEYISKKGKEMCHSIFIPIGRKIKQALIQERRREALKKKNAGSK